MVERLRASDESALDKLNDHAQLEAGFIHGDVSNAYEGTEKIGELPSMEEYAKKVRLETGNPRVDALSEQWIDKAIDQAKQHPDEVEPAEDMGNNFVDYVNRAYTREMSWHRNKGKENDPYKDLDHPEPLTKEDEPALNKLNEHAQMASNDLELENKALEKGEIGLNDTHSFKDAMDSLTIETGNEKVDKNSKIWVEESIREFNIENGFRMETPQSAEKIGNKFTDRVNQSYTQDMEWHQKPDDENLFGDGLDDLDQGNDLSQ